MLFLLFFFCFHFLSEPSFNSPISALLSDVGEPVTEKETDLDLQLNGSYMKALDGFLMVLSEDGDMIYLSENISKCLGLAQVAYIEIFFFCVHQRKHQGRSSEFPVAGSGLFSASEKSVVDRQRKFKMTLLLCNLVLPSLT